MNRLLELENKLRFDRKPLTPEEVAELYQLASPGLQETVADLLVSAARFRHSPRRGVIPIDRDRY